MPSKLILQLLPSILAASLAAPALGLWIAPAPVPMPPYTGVDPTFQAEAHVLAVFTGMPTGGVLLAGSVAATDVTVVFDLELDAGAAQSGGFFVVTHPDAPTISWTGMGWIPGPDLDLTGAGIGSYATFGPAAFLAPGQSTDIMFVSTAVLPVFADFEFVIVGASDGEEAVGFATVIPEPTTGLLLLAGIAALALRAR
jgi:hypothetical protein